MEPGPPPRLRPVATTVDLGADTPPPDVPPSVEPREHFVGLDGARAVAALGVVIVHATLLSGYVFRSRFGPFFARADIGVEIFFLLSGFLLYRPFVARRLAGMPSADLGSYARRRFLRIFPAYWVALTIIAFVMRAPPFPTGHSVVAHYLLLHVFDINQVSGGPIQQAWTLSCEVSFYIFLPFWAWLMTRRDRNPERQIRVEVVGVAALWTASMLLKVVLLATDLPISKIGWLATWLPLRLDQFALGMALAVASAWISHRGISLPAWFRGAPGVLGCWAVAIGAFVWVSLGFDLPLDLSFTPRQFFFTRTSFSFIALFFLVPIVLGRQDRGPSRTLLGNGVMVWLGLVSYGIYLWHEAWMFQYLKWTDQPELNAGFVGLLVVSLTLTIITAAISWYVVERPIMGWRRRPVARPRPTGSRPGPGAADG
jgi:peptidoglycan/LPS O-acetylase OafA/YrhL